MRLQDKDLAVLHTASTDETRFNLNAIRFDSEAGRLYATDGHVLAWVPMPEADEGEAQLESFSIPLTEAVRLVKDIKSHRKECHPQLRDEFGAQLDVKATNENGAAVIRLPGQERQCDKVIGEYPDINQVIPDTTAGWLEVGISVAVLERIIKVVKARCPSGRAHALKFQFDNSLDEKSGLPKAGLGPFRVSGGGPDGEVEFVGMPMRL